MMGGSSHSFWKSDAKLEVHSPVGLPGRAENGLSREDAEVPASVTKRGSATTVQGRQQQHAQGRMRLEDRYSAVRRLERQQHDGNRGTGGDGQPSARRGGGGGWFSKRVRSVPPSLAASRRGDTRHSGVLQHGTSAALLYSDGPLVKRCMQRGKTGWIWRGSGSGWLLLATFAGEA